MRQAFDVSLGLDSSSPPWRLGLSESLLLTSLAGLCQRLTLREWQHCGQTSEQTSSLVSDVQVARDARQRHMISMMKQQSAMSKRTKRSVLSVVYHGTT